MAWQDLEQQYVKENNKNDRSNYLKDIIAGLSIANNNTPQTLIGYGLGRWLSNYVNRGLERRQQDKNQKAYDEWINGGPQVTPQEQQLMPMMQGTQFVDGVPQQMAQEQQGIPLRPGPMFTPKNDNSFANNIAKAMTGAPTDYIQNAIEAATGHKQGESFFNLPQNNQQPEAEQQPEDQQSDRNLRNQPQNIKQTAQDIARQMWGGANLSSEEAFANAYRIARANGSTETQALDFARKTAGQQQARRIQALSDEFLANGVGLDGVINPYGVQVLSRLAQEDPKQTNILGNMYQTPLANTKYQQDLAKMVQNNDLHLRNAREMADVNYRLKELSSDADLQRKISLMNATEERKANNAFQYGYIAAKMNGATEEEAQKYGQLSALQSLAGISGGGRSGGGSRGSNDDAKAEKQRYEQIKDYLERYDKQNKDSLGEWRPGKGPGDPEYDERVELFNRYSAKQYDADNYNDAIRFTQSLIEKGYPPEAIAEYVDENFGEMASAVKRDLGLK